jgi:biotin-dependent carboxylase-like uncharacterized protein
MASLHVIRAGLQTTVQDRGRWGFQAKGVPVAGAMDLRAHRTANALAGNGQEAATLEITLAGPELEFEDERRVAVCGALFELTVDDVRVPADAPFTVPAGSTLRFGRRTSGARAYLAIGGGIAVPPILGSRSTHVASRLGGFDGRALIAGDRLPLGERRAREHSGQMTTGARLLPRGHARLRVLPGPQQDLFVADALDALQSARYSIESQSDRMGFRLLGPALAYRGSADIISDATPLGALQVPPSGQPMLLMADRHTTNGYPKIATVITADIGTAAQLAPGDAMSFEVCTLGDAMAALVAEERAVMAIEARV